MVQQSSHIVSEKLKSQPYILPHRTSWKKHLLNFLRLGNFGMFSQALRFYNFCNLPKIWEAPSRVVLLSFEGVLLQRGEIGIIFVSLLIFFISPWKTGIDYKYLYSKYLDVKKRGFLELCAKQCITRGIFIFFLEYKIF